jgi:hypothetical protein
MRQAAPAHARDSAARQCYAARVALASARVAQGQLPLGAPVAVTTKSSNSTSPP